MATIDKAKNTHRVTATVDETTFQRLQFWADKKGISINQYLNEAIDLSIDFENKNYPLPTLEQGRLAQLIDATYALSSNLENLENIITNGFDSLLGLTRGDNYLLEQSNVE